MGPSPSLIAFSQKELAAHQSHNPARGPSAAHNHCLANEGTEAWTSFLNLAQLWGANSSQGLILTPPSTILTPPLPTLTSDLRGHLSLFSEEEKPLLFLMVGGLGELKWGRLDGFLYSLCFFTPTPTPSLHLTQMLTDFPLTGLEAVFMDSF